MKIIFPNGLGSKGQWGRLCAAFISMTGCVSGQAGEDGRQGRFYFTANLGASLPQGTTISSADEFIAGGSIDFDPGARLDVGFGYYLTDWLSAEVDSGVLINVTSLNDEFGDSGDVGFYQVPILANVIYHIPTTSRFHPFIGVGFGGVQSLMEDYDLFYGRSDGDFGLAWQGTAGCRYQLSPQVDLGIAYKYLGTTDRGFDSFGIKMDGTHTHSFTASMSLTF